MCWKHLGRALREILKHRSGISKPICKETLQEISLSVLAQMTHCAVIMQNAEIIGNRLVGALAGQNYGKVKVSSVSGHVIGKSGVGGLAGYNSGTIQTSYATGDVDGSYIVGIVGIVGGLVGHNERGT